MGRRGIMPACMNGRDTWSDENSSQHCCNGWHRELRIDGPEPGDDPEGRTLLSHLPDAAFVWVKDECQAKEAHFR